MLPLDESVLVSADLPLRQFIPLIPTVSHRLVLDGTTIQGIVTWSDLQKLPIRLYAFSLVTHLEMVMAAVIQTTFLHDEWTAMLSEGRQKKIEEKRQSLRRKNNEPRLIELTDLCDKREILARQPHLGKTFAQDVKAIGDLRDVTAHGGTYAEDPDAVREFVRRLQQTEYWIGKLTGLTTAHNHAV